MRDSGDLSTTLIISGVVLLIGISFLFVIFPNIFKAPTQLWLGDGVFDAKVALDDYSRKKGLSGANELKPTQVLLMAFPTDGKWGIWMKDMKMPIDIIWLNKDKKVIYMVKNASPETSILKTYEPKSPARYVIELPAGTVDSSAIKINSVAFFEVNSGDIK